MIIKFVFFLTIISRARVGYEMTDSQLGATRLVGYNHLVSNKRVWNNSFIKNNHEKSPNLVDLGIFSFSPDAYSYHICWAWYNGSHTVAAKPIKTNCIIQ